MSDALDRLADAAGIEARYWDIQGRLHERNADTARRLLGAFGIPAETDAEVEASLGRLLEEPWQEVLPPAIFAWEGEPGEVLLRLAERPAMRSLRWSAILENGEHLAGELDLQSTPVEASREVAGAVIHARRLRLPAVPAGYHRFNLEGIAGAVLVSAPRRCYLPPDFSARRYWGVSAQLYSLRSSRNWGMGDFGDLHALADLCAASGADALGLNPLHALYLDAPQQASPYSPSSRLFLNPLYLDVPAIPDFAESADARALAESSAISDALHAAKAAGLVEYPAVAAAKLAVLGRLHRHFRRVHEEGQSARASGFRKFLAEGSGALHRFATFQMLAEQQGSHDWKSWPHSWRDPACDEVARLAQDHVHRVDFFAWLQWQCAVQLGEAAERARAGGMAIGLYNDLAVSVDASSADHWCDQALFAGGARVGAPPDPFNEAGQEWGVVPFNPRRLRAGAYGHLVSLLRANMRHAGALRIDHIMGWQRLFIVPEGRPPVEGAYVRFPLDDVLAIAALESRRNACVLIGEDLGTVPEGFRERMAEANVLSCRILYFEREHGRFRRPEDFPELAAVSVATHDLATLRGYWTAEDIAAKARLGIYASEEEEMRAREERARDKAQLVVALAAENLLPEDADAGDASGARWSPALAAAIQAYLARSRSRIFLAQLDDLTQEQNQANLPGSTVEYPNWRRRLSRTLEELANDPDWRVTAAAITRERTRPT